MQQSIKNAFGHELVFQSGAAIGALKEATSLIERYIASGRIPSGLENPYHIFAKLHAFISHAANVSKIFWPIVSPMRKNESLADYEQRLPRIIRGRELREIYTIPDDSVLRLRNMRDNIEHYDERLDEFLNWWSENGANQTIADVMLLEPAYIQQHGLPSFRMRQYDCVNKIFYFQGQQLELQPIEAELTRVVNMVMKRK
ncbi:hypothetical protein MUN81_10545 [Hymenobacter sp. 5317J-9]|uniref:hypothetical protein n=1 Tax=Hymenobacter sp. 5317J-9 TaxID=2932250 RepID=UPI001FD6A360|nr:hypothetical protein [Hymenobacter sp. 5317J-9]UOQ99918.1 hypothetical protein MUN81_10545 [Hymenobacter sp. 5317J-9]